MSMALLPSVEDGQIALAILFRDSDRKARLVARDLRHEEGIWDLELDRTSTALRPTAISNTVIPPECVPQLIPVHPSPSDNDEEGEDDDDESSFLGGVMVVGGRKLLFYEMASEEARVKQQNKINKTEKLKADSDPSKAKAARLKEVQRATRILKPTVSIQWPGSNITT